MNPDEQLILLRYLTACSGILRDRFGPKTTLAELAAAFICHQELVKGNDVTVTSLAKMSGVSTSTLSVMVRRRPYLKTSPDPNDDRVKLISFDDQDKRLQYLDALLDAVRSAQAEPSFVRLDVGAEGFLKASDME